MWVGSEISAAGQIFINLGAGATVPDISGLNHVDYLTNSSMIEIDFLPCHLLVLDGGYVGLEFGQMSRRFGSEVGIVTRGSRLGPHEDEDVSAAITEVPTPAGFTDRTDVEYLRIDRQVLVDAGTEEIWRLRFWSRAG